MKKTLFAILLLSSAAGFAQSRYDRNNQPPTTVQRSFQRDNPNVSNPSWSRRDNEWHATYRDNNNRDVETNYDYRGRRKDTHITWENRDVPQQVDRTFSKRYHAKNYNVVKIERPNLLPLFQLTFQIGGKSRKVYMDERGRETQYNDHH